jgi:hypothetical protein
MKKLLILLFSILISFNSYAGELNSLFGITLNDNAEKHFSISYVESFKSENADTLDGYFDVFVTDLIEVKSPYFLEYVITTDINNNIHAITGLEVYENIDRCKAVLETLSSLLKERYEVDFEYWEPSFPSGKKYEYYFYNSLDNYFGIQCKEDDNFPIIMMIYIESKDYATDVNKFYESGL